MRNEGGRRGSWEKASDRGDKVTRDGEGHFLILLNVLRPLFCALPLG